LHQPTKDKSAGTHKFKSVKQDQRFVNINAAVFNPRRYLGAAETYTFFRLRLFTFGENAAMV
jgi:hypothetical protein